MTDQHSAPASRTFGLDVLRALAISAVLISHSRIFLKQHWPAIEEIHIGGFFGVELFFVLSGFLIGGILLKLGERLASGGELVTFYKRRWLRTLPNYFLFIAVNLLVLFLIGKGIPKQIWMYPFFIHNFAWIPPGFFAESWSLSVEEWFYLLVPFVFYLLLRWGMKLRPAYLCTGLLFLILPTVGRAFLINDVVWDAAVRKIVVLRLDAIMYGILAAAVSAYLPEWWRRNRWLCAAGGAGLLLLGAAAYYPSDDLDRSYFARTLLFSITSLGFALLLPVCDLWKSVSSDEGWFARGVRWIALWSYSLYLCHFSIRTLLRHYLGNWYTQSLSGGIIVWILFFAISLLVSAIVYRYFEKPIMDLRDRKVVHPPDRAPVLAA